MATPDNLIARGGEEAAGLMFNSGASDEAMGAEAVPQGTVTKPVSATTDSVVKTGRHLGTAPAAKGEKKKGPAGDINVTGTVDKIYLPGEVAAKQIHTENEKAYTYAVGQSTLTAGRAAEASNLQWYEINQNDYEGRQQLIDQEFPKFRRANEQISKDIDDARAMKVNPYNYMSSVGRTGRIASVLSVGISQLAAGAGNTSSVSQRLDAAVNRDIAAQTANIAQAWKGVEAKRALNKDELDLMEAQFNFQDRARAVAYAAIAAKLGAAKQHSANEITYYNMEMVETRAHALSIEAAAQARAKLATYQLDAKVSSVHAAGRKAAKIRQLAEQAQVDAISREGAGTAAYQQAQGMNPDLTPEGYAAASGQPTLPGAAPAAPAPTEQAAVAPVSPAAAASQDRRVAAKAPSSPVEAAPVQDAPLGTGPLSNQEAYPATKDDGSPTPTARAEGPAVAEAKAAAKAPKRSLLLSQGPEVRRAGSNAGAAQAARNEPVTAPTLDEMEDYLSRRPADIAVATNINDAKLLASTYPIPKRSDAVFGGKGGQAQYDLAMRHYNHTTRFPELFMKDVVNEGANGEYVAGRANYLDPSVLDGTLRIREGREHLLSDPKARADLESEINATIQEAERVVDTAAGFDSQGGTGAFLGMRFSADKGFSIDKFDEDAQATQWKAQRLFLGASIKAIKDRDPSGRLSNEDVGFGEQLASMMNAGGAKLDQLQRAYYAAFGEEGDMGQIQAAAGRVFAYIAHDMMAHLDTTISPNIVMSLEASEDLAKKANKVGGFVNTTIESKEKRQAMKEKRLKEYDAKRGSVGEAAGLGARALDAAIVNPLNPADIIESATFLPRELYGAAKGAFGRLTSDEE